MKNWKRIIMNQKLRISFAEAKYILSHLSKEEQHKIPVQLRRLIIENHDKEHIVDVDHLSKRTYALLAVLYRKYLAENKAEVEKEYRERLQKEKIMRQNKSSHLNRSKPQK